MKTLVTSPGSVLWASIPFGRMPMQRARRPTGVGPVTIIRPESMKISPSKAACKRQIRNAEKLRKQNRPKKRTASGTTPVNLDTLEPVHRQAGGIDVGSFENYVAIPESAVKEGE